MREGKSRASLVQRSLGPQCCTQQAPTRAGAGRLPQGALPGTLLYTPTHPYTPLCPLRATPVHPHRVHREGRHPPAFPSIHPRSLYTPRYTSVSPVPRAGGSSGEVSGPQTQQLHFSPCSLTPQVVEAYKQGLRPAVGYELNPWLLWLARYRARKAGYEGKVSFLKQDLWKVTAAWGSGCAGHQPGALTQ